MPENNGKEISVEVPVSEVINKLEDRNEVITIAVTLPVALSLDQGLLDLGDQGLVPLHHGLEY